MTLRLTHLFSPLTIRPIEIRNRIFSTGHQVNMLTGGLPNARLAAYHEARAAGGAGLIVIEAARMHDSAPSDGVLDAGTDACIPGYRAIAEAVHRHGAKLFGQLSHPGRVNARVRDGLRDVPYSASAVRDDRFKNVPRPLTLAQIEELIAAYGAAAARFRAAGLDGVEVVASHGNLIAQFLNPRVNHRADGYGGSAEGRLRFLREALEALRAAVGEELVVGIRLSIDEKEVDGERKRVARLLAMQVDELELSVRSANCLRAAGISTLKEMVSKSEAEMLKFRNFGRKSLNELGEILTTMDLAWGMDVSKYDDVEIEEEAAGSLAEEF
ncbi:MAG: hypothetical protein IIB61_04350 [Planctomycetes bacterium]|nr:hypothetical protein [Planctomycetota bacterium]